MNIKRSKSRIVYEVFNYFFCILIGIICLAPVLNVLAMSLSSKEYIISGQVNFIPKGLTLNNYRYVTKDSQFYTAFGISVVRTILGTVFSMAMTIIAAYPLSMSKRIFRAKSVYIWLYIVPMVFATGLIPLYLMVSKLGLIDTMWSLILPYSVPVYNIILLMNYMKNLPDAIWEAARIDGADHFTCLTSVMIPLSLPSIATLCLFQAVFHWNDWYAGMLYINNNLKWPLQTYLRTVLVQVNIQQLTDVNSLSNMVATVGADTAKIFLSLFPMLVVYPLAQKYFIHGIVVGAVKG